MSGPMVGREPELAEIDGFLNARGELPGALLLEGAPGIGKTTLWQAAIDRARKSLYRVFIARPTGAETQISYAGLGDLLEEALPEALPVLPAPQARALRVALLLEEPLGAPPDQRAVAVAFLGALRALAECGPVLVAVDDIQWLDPPTATILEFAARRLGRSDVGLLMTLRSDEQPTIPLGLDRAFGNDALHRVSVRPLSLEGLHHLIAGHLGRAFPRPVMRRLHQTSGGNPFFALELARALARRESELAPGEPLPIPRTLGELVRERLAELPEETLGALLAAAAHPEPTMALIDAVVGGDAWTRLRPAAEAQIVLLEGGQVAFTHPLLASAVYGDADPRLRREVHRRLAEAATDPESRGRHLAMATEGPDEQVAVELDKAAEAALIRGAPAVGADLWEEASRLTADGHLDAWGRRAFEAAKALAEAGAGKRALGLGQKVVDRLPPGPMRAEARAWLLGWGPDPSFGEEALREAKGDLRVEALVRQAIAENIILLGDLRAALHEAQTAVTLAERAGDSTALVLALTSLGYIEGKRAIGDARSHLERAVELEPSGGRLGATGPPGIWLGLWHMWVDDLDRARQLFIHEYHRSLERGDEYWQAGLSLHLAEVEWRTGNWDRAQRYADECLRLDEEIGFEQPLCAPLFARSLIDSHRGEIERARADALRGLALAEEIGDRLWPMSLRWVLGFIEFSVGEYAAALSHHRWLFEEQERQGIENPSVVPFAADLIEALVAVGDLGSAQTHLESLELRGAKLGTPWPACVVGRCQGLLRAAQGDLDGAGEVLDRTLDQHNDLPYPFELGRTLLVKGQVHRRAKAKRAARDSIDRARRIFERLGASLWAERARDELRRVGLRPPAPLELTPTEQRVAELAASGLTNRQVAEALFVSPKTVEANLARVYRKLGIRSRAELGARIGGATRAFGGQSSPNASAQI